MSSINVDDFIDIIRDTLKVSYLNRTRTQLTVRCFECGDSRKNPYHAHLNVRLKDPDHLVWRCPRCEASGVVNSDFLRNLQVYNNQAMEFVHGNAMRIKKLRLKITGRKSDKLRDIINPLSDSDYAHDIVEYCNNRLGLDLSMETWVREYKLVVDFRKLFEINRWMGMTEDKNSMSRLADEGAGFISSDNSSIIFRNVFDNWEKRYFNYNVYPVSLPGMSTAYAPLSIIDPLEEKIEVVLTEGIFDIVGVREHCLKPEKGKARVYMANNGKSYMNTVNRIGKLGLINQHIKIYSDSDVPVEKFGFMKSHNPIMHLSPMEVFYNTLSKDCGVPKNKISLRRSLVK